jgi:arsenate reductase (thioredoxin)
MSKRILILCTGNSARSQMAEGFLKSFDSGLEVFSAGTHPASRVNPFAIQVMKEVGIDLSNNRPKDVREFLDKPFDYVITVCDKADKECPFFPGAGKRLHWPFSDPPNDRQITEEVLEQFRKVRDAILVRFKHMADTGRAD